MIPEAAAAADPEWDSPGSGSGLLVQLALLKKQFAKVNERCARHWCGKFPLPGLLEFGVLNVLSCAGGQFHFSAIESRVAPVGNSTSGLLNLWSREVVAAPEGKSQRPGLLRTAGS